MQEYIKYHSIQQKYKLSKRELEVINCFLDGNLSAKEISIRLSTTENSVNKAFQRIKDKYDLNTKSDIFKFFNNQKNIYY